MPPRNSKQSKKRGCGRSRSQSPKRPRFSDASTSASQPPITITLDSSDEEPTTSFDVEFQSNSSGGSSSPWRTVARGDFGIGDCSTTVENAETERSFELVWTDNLNAVVTYREDNIGSRRQIRESTSYPVGSRPLAPLDFDFEDYYQPPLPISAPETDNADSQPPLLAPAPPPEVYDSVGSRPLARFDFDFDDDSQPPLLISVPDVDDDSISSRPLARFDFDFEDDDSQPPLLTPVPDVDDDFEADSQPPMPITAPEVDNSIGSRPLAQFDFEDDSRPPLLEPTSASEVYDSDNSRHPMLIPVPEMDRYEGSRFPLLVTVYETDDDDSNPALYPNTYPAESDSEDSLPPLHTLIRGPDDDDSRPPLSVYEPDDDRQHSRPPLHAPVRESENRPRQEANFTNASPDPVNPYSIYNVD